MLPAGKITADRPGHAGGGLSAGDVVVDGGNSNYKEFMVDADRLAEKACTTSTPGHRAASGA